MTNIPDKTTFVKAYADKAPWDIGKPQPVFIEAADQITGFRKAARRRGLWL